MGLLSKNIDTLAALIDTWLNILQHAKFEAEKLSDAKIKSAAVNWANLCFKNITAYNIEFKQALVQKDPIKLSHAAAQLLVSPHYVDDYDYSWFSKAHDLNLVMSKIHDAALLIHKNINPFDAGNIEEVRQML